MAAIQGLQSDLFGGVNEAATREAAPPMMTSEGWQMPESHAFAVALKRGALVEALGVINRLNVETAGKVLVETGFEIGGTASRAEMMAPVQRAIVEAVRDRVTGHELRASRVARVAVQEETKLDPDVALRALWDEQGVPKERQDELIAQIASKAAPGAKVGPFVVGGGIGAQDVAAITNEVKTPTVELKARVLKGYPANQVIAAPTTNGYLAGIQKKTGRAIFVVDGNVDREVFRALIAERAKAGLDASQKMYIYCRSATYSGPGMDILALSDILPEVDKTVANGVVKDTQTNTEDAGAELTYNRRNRRGRGLRWDDIADKNDALRVKEVTKANVYPKPDYEAMVAGGMPAIAVHLVKQVYDAMATGPQVGRRTASDEDLQRYIEAVNRVMTRTEAWASDSKAVGAWAKQQAGTAAAMLGKQIDITGLAEREGLLDAVFPGGWKAFREDVIVLGGNKLLGALRPGYDEARRAIKDIEKGWPGKREAWQLQGYKMVNTAEVAEVRPTNVDGKYYIRVVNSFVESFADEATALAALAQYKPVLLLNKNNRVVGQFDTEATAQDGAREITKRDSSNVVISAKGRSVEDAERVGVVRRLEGENISSDRLQAEFGFKGVNFGNWMKGSSPAKVAERQLHLNHAFDAFHDLADILDVPPKTLSLNGMLGLAIGAQGSGKNLAHFVPGVDEINLTRTGGAGALAHEWGHAVDHYFAKLGGLERNAIPYLTEHVDQKRRETKVVDGRTVVVEVPFSDALRPEIVERVKAVVDAMTKRVETPEEVHANQVAALARTEKNVNSWLAAIRREFETGGRYRDDGVEAKRATALQTFDGLADRVRAGDYGDGHVAIGQNTLVMPVVNEIRDAYKAAFGRVVAIDPLKGLQSNLDSMRYSKESAAAGEARELRRVSSDYQRASNTADKGKAKPYWGTRIEMFARAFDAYVVDTLERRAAKNSYLAGIEAVPPAGEERKAINLAIGALVGELKTRETEQGVALYSVNEKPVRHPHSVESLVQAIDKAFPGTEDFARVLGATGRFEIIEAKDVAEDLAGAGIVAAASLGERDRESVETATRRLGRFVDEVVAGRGKDGDTQVLGDTPVVLTALGAKELALHIDGATVRKILDGKHKPFMTADMLKRIPESLYDPLMVFDSPKGGLQGKIMITEVPDRVGNPVVVAVHLEKATNGRYLVNDIASAYGLENAGPRLMGLAKNLEYIKNEESLALSSIPNLKGESMVGVVQKARSLGVTILTETDVVNRYGLRYSRNTEGEAFDGKEVPRTPMDKGMMTIEVDGVLRPAQNSAGKPIHWSEEGTRNFWRGFRESKAVDGEGRPLVGYHGTFVGTLRDGKTVKGDIGSFDRMFTTKFRKPSIDTVGSWFSSNPGDGGALMYAGGGQAEGGAIYPAFLAIENPHETTFHLMLRRSRLLANGNDDGRMIGEAEVNAYRKWLKDIGKDGIKLAHDEGAENGSTEFKNQVAWVALEPTQIKSAIGNRGTFNHESPDIRYSKDGRVLGYVVDGKTRLVADNISRTDDDVRGLLLHEVGVHVLRLGRSEAEFKAILSTFDEMRAAGDAKAVAAYARVPEGTPAHLVTEEAVGYYVEDNAELPFSKRVKAWFKEQVCKLAERADVLDRGAVGAWARSLDGADIVYMATRATRAAGVVDRDDRKVVEKDRRKGNCR